MQPIQGERRRRAGQKHRLCAAADTAGIRGRLSTHFEMYFMQGMDYAEIAEQLDTGKNTPRRWVTGIINELSVLLWGIDEERTAGVVK